MSPPQATNIAESTVDEVKKLYEGAWNIEHFFPAKAWHGEKLILYYFLPLRALQVNMSFALESNFCWPLKQGKLVLAVSLS